MAAASAGLQQGLLLQRCPIVLWCMHVDVESTQRVSARAGEWKQPKLAV